MPTPGIIGGGGTVGDNSMTSSTAAPKALLGYFHSSKLLDLVRKFGTSKQEAELEFIKRVSYRFPGQGDWRCISVVKSK